MKKTTIVFVLLLLNFFLNSCSLNEVPNISLEYNESNGQVEYLDIDFEIVEIINSHRVSIGLSALNILNEASKEAISHNEYMIKQGTTSHDYFFSRTENLKNKVNAERVSENVGYGYSSAQSIVNAWLNSERHRKNIESEEFTDFGVSTKKDAEYRNYFTNIFVKR